MKKSFKKRYRRKTNREDIALHQQQENNYHYPLEKPIIDIYREINTDMWRETFGDDIFHFK